MRDTLAVRIDDGNTDRHVSAHVSNLRFKRSAFGGDIDLTCDLTLPVGTFDDLGPGDTITVYDRATGDVVWSGNTDNPGQTTGPSGQGLQLQAFGGAARLTAAKTPLGYVMQDLGAWTRLAALSSRGVETSQAERGDGEATLDVTFRDGKNISPGMAGTFVNRQLRRAGLRVGRIRASVDGGFNSGFDYSIQVLAGATNDDFRVLDTRNLNTINERLLGGDRVDKIAPAASMAALRVIRNAGSGTVNANDNHWGRFTDVILRQRLVDRFGLEVTDPAAYAADTITADRVIDDMLGRGMAPGVDPAKVTIAATFGYGIDNLDWIDGITMADALSELLVFHRDLFWTVYGDTATFGTWDHARPRYWITSAHGGITLPGQEFTLCNRVVVSWTDRKGDDRTTVVTTTVPGLDYTRDAEPISLNDGSGSERNAQRAGDWALAITNNPPRAGTAVLTTRIFDAWSGCMVAPHEVMPGCVVVEQETGNQFRLTEVDYSDDAGAVTLTLGEPVRTIEQVLARVRRKQRRRRRRK